MAIGAWLIVGVLVWTRVGGAGDRAEALEAGWMRLLACRRLELRERRANRWLRRRDAGRLADGKPGGGPLHAILAEESEAILALFEEWGQVDRSHRKLARCGSYLGRFWCSPRRWVECFYWGTSTSGPHRARASRSGSHSGPLSVKV